jgi:MFS family permease
VFLRTSKTGSDHHRLRTALRLCRWEASFSIALFTSAGLLAASAHPPFLLIFFICVQGIVYVCSPIASLWNLRAQLVPPLEFRRRFEERRLLQARRRRPSFTMAAGLAAVLLAFVVGTTAAALVAPRTLEPVGGVRHPGVVTIVRAPTGVVRSPAVKTAEPATTTDRSLPLTTRAR